MPHFQPKSTELVQQTLVEGAIFGPYGKVTFGGEWLVYTETVTYASLLLTLMTADCCIMR